MVINNTIFAKSLYFRNCLTIVSILVFFLTVSGGSFSGQENIQAELDSTQVQVGDSFNLIITSHTRSSNEPDFARLQKQLDVAVVALGRAQSSSSFNMSFGSSSNNSQYTQTWTLPLLAKKPGTYIIPPIYFGKQKTSPITLTVSTPSATNATQVNNPVTTTATIQYKTAYPDQINILTLEAEITGLGIENYAFQLPENTKIHIAPLGDARTFKRKKNGKVVLVIQQRYTLEINDSGNFQLDDMSFQAIYREGRNTSWIDRRPAKRIFREITPLAINIKPIPKGFENANWIIAQSLTIEETWSPEIKSTIKQGDSLTRTLRINGKNIHKNAIPNIEILESEDFKLYPAQAQRHEEFTSSALTSLWQNQYSYIFSQAGTVEIPEQKILWWNSSNNSLSTLILPKRSIKVVPLAPSPTINTANNAENSASKRVASSNTPVSEPGSALNKQTNWWLVAANNLFWIVAIIGLYFFMRTNKNAISHEPVKTQENASTSKIGRAAKEKDTAVLHQELLNYISFLFPSEAASLYLARRIKALQNDKQWQEAIEIIERTKYKNHEPTNEQWRLLEQISGKLDAIKKEKSLLKNLYPSE